MVFCLFLALAAFLAWALAAQLLARPPAVLGSQALAKPEEGLLLACCLTWQHLQDLLSWPCQQRLLPGQLSVWLQTWQAAVPAVVPQTL